eukprot:CAMPEP_0173112358 /NCGR_PEP_ID=MMETSP1102-20130122/45962_1 /TAXON_ID=49646 /ORGANISM="Geminigera sp., Strain Caron Lab Isolate" /LENGTH=89 /DNA_ID=CAMNT_0014013397 /DNA_START=223 /DNA_END=487 /DNA_ORIENTATION=-
MLALLLAACMTVPASAFAPAVGLPMPFQRWYCVYAATALVAETVEKAAAVRAASAVEKTAARLVLVAEGSWGARATAALVSGVTLLVVA